MIRLFVGIEIPAEIRAALIGAATTLDGGKWVDVEQIHLTLRFIGQVEEPTFEELRASLAEVKGARFPLAIGGSGAFPNPRRARIVWAGVAESVPLAELKAEVDRRISLPDADADRPFHPHLTLARLKDPRPKQVQAALQNLAALSFEPFVVERFTLFSSRLGREGAKYTAEARYPLG